MYTKYSIHGVAEICRCRCRCRNGLHGQPIDGPQKRNEANGSIKRDMGGMYVIQVDWNARETLPIPKVCLNATALELPLN